MRKLTGWQVVGIIFGVLVLVTCLSILIYTFTGQHPPAPVY